VSRIAVIGLDGNPLRPEAVELLEGAALVAGGRRHLGQLTVAPDRAVAIEGDLSGALSRIEGTEGPVVVVASGDPGFFGIVRTLGERFGTEALRVLPAVSSVALAFARAGISWDDAVTVSAHGRDPRRAVNVCRARPKVAVLTSPDFGPAELARALKGLGLTLIVAERLGAAWLAGELEIVGKPLVSVVAFTSRNLNIYDIADGMSGKGWHLNALQDPPAIHVAVTMPIVKVWERLVADLEAVVEEEREKERVRMVEGKGTRGKAVGDSAALYGVAGSLPNKSVVVDLATGFLDLLYKA